MEGWDPLLRNKDYASSSPDEENEQENEGSRNGEKYESDKEVDKVSESSCMQGYALFYDSDNNKRRRIEIPLGFTLKETSVNEVHEKEIEAPSEEVRWDGECVIMGDFNEVFSEHERYGSVFNVQSAAAFNNFISLTSLIDLPLDGYAYTWIEGFDTLVEDTWMHMDITDSNGMILLKKKLQALKIIIREWTKNTKKCSYKKKSSIQSIFSDIDKIIDQGGSNEVILNDRSILLKELHDIISMDMEEMAQKAKVRWAIEVAVMKFFSSCTFPKGCNSSFIALIPKTQNEKTVKDFRPISLIRSLYKIIAKILANRLSYVIPDLISDVQSAFISNRQILDGPFILNKLLSWCKYKKLKAMVFKVDFEKAFDSIRWDYLDDVLKSFGFGDKWRGWISGCLKSAKGSVLVNGSPTPEFQFHIGLKQGNPVSPFLFILIKESLHLSFKKVMNAGLFTGIPLDNSLTISHLFYADDAIFVGK
nr:RNA-directed DNA polymerase, eukaryota, reverse transcriptase zinc-binding domain protein [Tanacetum cinerariifolium]